VLGRKEEEGGVLRALVDAGTTGYVHLKERKEVIGAVYVVAVACARRRRRRRGC
jgi:hypothetical protein